MFILYFSINTFLKQKEKENVRLETLRPFPRWRARLKRNKREKMIKRYMYSFYKKVILFFFNFYLKLEFKIMKNLKLLFLKNLRVCLKTIFKN